ncbi:thiamine biosynthesis protein ApbE [Polaribacter reichenbachii]|uniref:FAD:protein FMN transferase n=1 Tax=Polaribacter reichenbachii TaxID=996801 RepID=A0A1B8U6A3_9FLAO|nr:FAD:protein FMN transferase [Polaribacter reichenbachii]APZ46186.1 thiamine biosynthesis protein ApbE [Polaribacter reichenbachii]AUC20048.1 thiamine biosynthesis protein ApbE [Polaribacter reichenbachii]OBY67404.1 thiamine biosynthesis protein ApbE [Polaribacter reichenbachii]
MKVVQRVLFFLALLLFTACKKEIKKQDYVLKGGVFGTTYKITYLNASKNYQKSLDSLFLIINNSVSTYIPTSDISKVNKGEENIIIDDIFAEVFKKSKKIHKETNGFFDPTVGNLVNAYGFGPKKEKVNLTNQEIDSSMQFVGLDKVVLKNGAIVKENPQVYLDFNSIAKGFGIDIVSRFFDAKQINSYLIEIGGEIRAKGLKNNSEPWVIKLVNPVKADDNDGFKVINLSDKSMATSGNYRKFRITEDGKKYVHTINPKTGLATESNLLSASVIAASDCADVDAYATAFMAMGLEKTKEFLEKHPEIKVILIYADTDGSLLEFSTY